MCWIVPALGLIFAWASAPVYALERLSVHAEPCSVAIGGNVTNSTINVVCGIPPEKLEELVRLRTKDLSDLSESQRETNALLKEKLDLNQRQVKSALEILGEADVPPERLAAKLVEIAERFKELRTAAAAQPGDDSKITALKAAAQKAIQDGELDKAKEILAKVEKIQDDALERLALNAAQTAAQVGEVALTQLRYPEKQQGTLPGRRRRCRKDTKTNAGNTSTQRPSPSTGKGTNSATTPRRCRRLSAIAI